MSLGPHWRTMSAPTAYRLGDGAPVTIDSARAIWAAVAREVLEEADRRHTMLSHSDLARQLQLRSGVYTKTPVADWLPAVLAALADTEMVLRVRPDAQLAARPATATVTRRQREPAQRKRSPAPPKICPTCFMQLPASGRCDTCG